MGPLSDVIATVNRHADWANARMFAAAERLSPEQLTRPVGSSDSSIRDTLHHQFESQETWIERVFGLPANDGRPASELPDVASFRVWAGELAALLAHHVAEAGEGGLASAATYSSSSRVWTQPRWQLLLHQANHQMQHRSEIALWLTQLGCSPGNLDMLFYLREQEAVR